MSLNKYNICVKSQLHNDDITNNIFFRDSFSK